MHMKAATMVAATLIMSACTSNLQVTKYNPEKPNTGYPYSLRFTQYEVGLTWRVISCKPGAENNDLGFKLSTTVKSKTGFDRQHRYIVDPSSLQGLFRSGEFTMTWHEDRGVASISSTADDKSGAIIGAVIGGATKLVGAGLVGAGPGTCPDELVKTLQEIGNSNSGQTARVAKVQKDVDDQTYLVTKLTAQVAAEGVQASKATREQLASAEKALKALIDLLETEKSRLSKLVEFVTDTQTITWPQHGAEWKSTEAIVPTGPARVRWQANSGSKDFAVFFSLVPLDPSVMSASGNTEPLPGLPYREPQPVRFDICTGNPCGIENAKVVSSTSTLALQGGQMLYLPFQARTFASIKSSATFSQAGVLTAAGVSQIRSAGEGAADAFKTAATETAALVDASRTAETKRLKAKADEAAARKALADAETDIDKKAMIETLKTETALATAERAMIEAQMALASARAAQEP